MKGPRHKEMAVCRCGGVIRYDQRAGWLHVTERAEVTAITPQPYFGCRADGFVGQVARPRLP